jgi:hypothetical protein
MLFQETMGMCDQIIYELGKLFLGWDFIGLDSKGLSGGIISCISLTISLISCFSVKSGVHCKALDHTFLVWDKFLNTHALQVENIIIGGD